jgi:DNA polymerase I
MKAWHFVRENIDYAQLELRVASCISKDADLYRGFSEALDMHSVAASEIFNVVTEEVTGEKRRFAKAIGEPK